MSNAMSAALSLGSTPHAMSLRDLLQGLVSEPVLQQLPEVMIHALSMDSRRPANQSVFLAVPGTRGHGLDHAAQAISNGASVVLFEPQQGHDIAALTTGLTVPGVAVPRLHTLLGSLADRFYGQPSVALRIAAVTGTNGKSTTAWLIADAAQRCGLAAGYSGTVGYGRMGQLQSATHTTPDVINMHRQLAELHEQGAQVAGIEVSSHALHQHRIDGVRLDTAVFTNLSRDHLDYHGTLQAYGEAKAMLFTVPGLRHRIINGDDAFGRELLTRHSTASLTTAYTCASDVDAPRVLRARAVTLRDDGLQIAITGSFGDAVLTSSLLGRFNAENLLAALAVLLGWEIPLSQAVQVLQQASAPPGRMELIAQGGKRAVVDYAHTPDALQKALHVLQAHARGRVICVFGCGGDRDAGKRAPMGAIAAQGADEIILTNDNPRSEDPARIIEAIEAGMAGRAHQVQPDRAAAIEQALHMATADDLVLIAGKGHEDYQIIGDRTMHFSDREVVQACLRGAA